MPRNIYFIGIALPEQLSKDITNLQRELYTDPAMLRPLVPHVTLLNPPSLLGIQPHELVPKIRQAAESYLPLTIELSGAGFFKDTTAFIEVESHSVIALQQRLLKLLPPDIREQHYVRSYRPHVTIAQIHQPRSLDKQLITKKVEAELHLPVRCEISSVSCFRWIKPRDYSVEAI